MINPLHGKYLVPIGGLLGKKFLPDYSSRDSTSDWSSAKFPIRGLDPGQSAYHSDLLDTGDSAASVRP
jgi:hypothetical protein